MGKLIALMLISAAALAASPGSFGFLHDVVIYGYEDATACENDMGKWDPSAGCVFEVEDLVEVDGVGEGYQVRVSTVGTNADVCDFQGAGWLNDAGQIVATEQTEEWDEDKGQLVPVTCELTVFYGDENTVSTRDNGKCRSLCGMRASLEVTGATRK